MVSIATYLFAAIGYGIAFLIAVLQLLLVVLVFLLGLAFVLIAFPIYVIKQTLFK